MSLTIISILIIILTCDSLLLIGAHGGVYHLEMRYKFSQELQRQQESVPFGMQAFRMGFYQTLARHDQRRRRHLAEAQNTSAYSFAPTNETYELSNLGGLHYSFITVGSPSKEFLVALDTGSDLLWLPCNCIQCASANWTLYGYSGLSDFAIYSPEKSTTSKNVPCTNAICDQTLSPKSCSSSQICTYNATYLSANTSTSGTIVEDVLHLNSEDPNGKSTTTPIYFGCGTTQTGQFLEGSAPNGLLGLGPAAYSVPTVLAKNSLVSNIFSMCFAKDYSGRLVFGKSPSTTAKQTPLLKNLSSLFYALNISNIGVGASTITAMGGVVFDTGTSITTLPSKIIDAIGGLINDQIPTFTSFAVNIQGSIVFKYCWNMTTDAEYGTLPNISITLHGGNVWEILSPYVVIEDNSGNPLFVCLAVVEDATTTIAIIGHNFMVGYEFFFDQGSMTFSWDRSNCYTSNGTESLQTSEGPSVDTFIPTPSPSLSPHTTVTSNSNLAPSPHSSKAQMCTSNQWLSLLIFASLTLMAGNFKIF